MDEVGLLFSRGMNVVLVGFLPREVDLSVAFGRYMGHLLERFAHRCRFDGVIARWKLYKEQWAIGNLFKYE